MLTFERILNAFAPYLDDMEVEIVKARRGYIMLTWLERQQMYDDSVSYCATPEALKEQLLGIYENALVFQRTRGKREETEEDKAAVASEVRSMDECL